MTAVNARALPRPVLSTVLIAQPRRPLPQIVGIDVTDKECTEFLQWGLPRLRLAWPGFRRVRKQVCKRVARRIDELELSGLAAYRTRLGQSPGEWKVLDGLCRITISRFYRDRGVFDAISTQVLPSIVRCAVERGDEEIRCWSVGCGSGEEAYTVQIMWKLSLGTSFSPGARGPQPFPPVARCKLPLRVTASDVDGHMLERASRGCYPKSSVKDLPVLWLESAFSRYGDQYVLGETFRENVTFIKQDIRHALAEGSFHIILCRNLVFTYFDEELQMEILNKILCRLLPDGILAVGIHESLPQGASGLSPFGSGPAIYKKDVLQ
ncbi:MAG: chemotaxis protein CheR [Candidatus Krumholzibacteria bacterium]|nr:chemotaxis protein CheR [Candidatus Krumholzibacteria bacterium]